MTNGSSLIDPRAFGLDLVGEVNPRGPHALQFLLNAFRHRLSPRMLRIHRVRPDRNESRLPVRVLCAVDVCPHFYWPVSAPPASPAGRTKLRDGMRRTAAGKTALTASIARNSF